MSKEYEWIQFQTEAWSEYAVGLIVLAIRIIYRCSVVGFDWQGDDWFAAIAVLFWTGELVVVQLVGQFGSITGMTNELALTLTEEQKHNIEIGSKILLFGWVDYITLIWCLKACMLFLYNRLTSNTQQHRLVRTTSYICAVSYIATIIVCLSKCGPIQRHWQVYPYPGDACALNIPNYLALVTTNVATDLLILYIPIPLLLTVQLPMRRKILYGLWLCTGVFIIIATILRCVLSLADKTQITQGTIWAVRETVVAIVAVNIPVLTPLIKAVTAMIGGLTSRKSTAGADKTSRGGLGETGKSKNSAHQLSVLESRAKTKRIRRGMGWTTMNNESEEKMIEEGGTQHLHPKNSQNNAIPTISAGSVHSDENVERGKIQVTSTFEVEVRGNN